MRSNHKSAPCRMNCTRHRSNLPPLLPKLIDCNPHWQERYGKPWRRNVFRDVLDIQSCRFSLLWLQVSELDTAHGEIRALNTNLNTLTDELGEARAAIRQLKDVVANKTDEIVRNQAAIEALNSTVADRVSDLAASAADLARVNGVVEAKEAEITGLNGKIAELESLLQAKEKARQELQSRVEAQSAQLGSLAGDKDILVNKLTDDLAKVMGELQRVQNQLHKAQDMVAYLEPFARVIIDLREKQRKWDADHDAIASGTAAVGASPFAKLSASRKLGPRPTLTL